MSDITPKAKELAEEKGIDPESVKGSGKDGRVLVEDVEALLESEEAEEEAAEAAEEADEEAMESEAPADDAEVVGEVGGDPLVVSQPSPESSVESFKAHPHVPVVDQSPEELKDFQAESLESVEGGLEAAGLPPADDAEEDDADEADSAEADEAVGGPEVGGEESGPGSSDWILKRGERERGYYVIPEQVNPLAEAARKAAEEDEAAQVADESDLELSRPAEHTGVVDTSAGDAAPTHSESLEDKSPSVADVTEKGGPGTVEADSKNDE